MGRINKCHRYMIDITRMDPISLGEFGGSSALASLVPLDMLGQ